MRIEACWECGKNEEVHYHHVVPRSLGGTRALPLCLECHGKVHGKRMNSGELVKAAYKRLVAEHGKGNFAWGSTEGLKNGRIVSLEKRRQRSLKWAHSILRAVSSIDPSETLSLSERTHRLNELGFSGPRGGKLYPTTLVRAIARARKNPL